LNNIESIIKRIANDAQAQAQQKIDEAQAEAKQILADYEQQAKTLSQQTQERAQKEAAVIAERVESQSGLIRRNMMLQYKRQAIEQAFQKALEVLCAQESGKQVELLSAAAAKYITSDAQVLLNEKDSAAFGQALIEAIGNKLKEQNKPYAVSLSPNPASIQGGMILAEGNIETNLSYEILIKNMRDELEAEVARVLTE
jgi:V/A-type H+-transporting ATPase subunit E